MSKARLTDFTGAEILPNKIVVYASRQGNLVRMTEAVVKELKSNRSTGRVIPELVVQPTGRDSGFIGRKTLEPQIIAAIHVVVIGDAPEGTK